MLEGPGRDPAGLEVERLTVAIQGLHALVETQGARLRALERELTALRAEAATLRVAMREAESVA